MTGTKPPHRQWAKDRLPIHIRTCHGRRRFPVVYHSHPSRPAAPSPLAQRSITSQCADRAGAAPRHLPVKPWEPALWKSQHGLRQQPCLSDRSDDPWSPLGGPVLACSAICLVTFFGTLIAVAAQDGLRALRAAGTQLLVEPGRCSRYVRAQTGPFGGTDLAMPCKASLRPSEAPEQLETQVLCRALCNPEIRPLFQYAAAR